METEEEIMELIEERIEQKILNLRKENTEYQKLERQAVTLFDTLCNGLEDEQRGILMDYEAVVNRLETMVHTQLYMTGLKDRETLLKLLGNGNL